MQKFTIFATTVLLALGIIAFSLAPTFAQDDGTNIPTPTPHPVENLDYELTQVGGEDITLTFPGAEADGITISETSVHSQYPRGMVFSMSASSENGDIRDVILFLEYQHGSSERFVASWDGENEVWFAHPWDGGNGQPAWAHFSFYWRVRDSSEVSLETEPQEVDYWDPTRQWWRAESEYIIMYWFGFEEVEPEYVAESITLAMNATEPRRIVGFGQALSYKPIGVIYPTREDLGEIFGSGQSNTNAAGWTSNDLGMTIQHISMPTDEWFERLENCIYLTPREERTEQWRVDRTIFGTIPHEVAHLYQFETGGGRGPNWWSEGQADYFTYAAGNYDSRLRNLATLQDLDTLDGNLSAFTFESDGCYALAYDVGVSFINWLLTNYGGIETHAEIVELVGSGIVMQDALEQVTGVPFNELQNQWRAYIGFNVLSLADIDPASALDEPIAPLFQVGDTFTITGFRTQPLYENPGPAQLSQGGCFPNTEATVLRVGSLDGVNYYEVDCGGLVGWMTEEQMR